MQQVFQTDGKREDKDTEHIQVIKPEYQPALTKREKKAVYLYGVVDYTPDGELDTKGVNGSAIFLSGADGLMAVVHRCSPQPYTTDNEELAKTWVEAHNRVLEKCLEKFPAVLPFTFNTILHDPGEKDPGTVIKKWLAGEHRHFKDKLDKVRGRCEYGIQLLWNPGLVAEELTAQDRDIRALKKELKEKSQGSAYFMKEKIKKVIKGKMEEVAIQRHKEIFGKISLHCVDYKVDKNKDLGDSYSMISNWSCLIEKEQMEELGSILEEVDSMQGYKVRFTGPWPPYSFVS